MTGNLDPWSLLLRVRASMPLTRGEELILAKLHIIKEKVDAMSDALSTSIATLVADNVALQAEIAAAPAAIATLVATAIANQAAAGVTPAQMQSLADLHTALSGDTAQLTAALAGTPPAPPVVTPPAAA
jgi:hypothetical protein